MSGNLSANPIQEATYRTGKPALILLILTLAITPMRRILSIKSIIPLRRILGLYTFFYATLHFSVFVVLDYFFDWELIKLAIGEKPYVLVGFTAYVTLILMALTSTKGWQRRLKKWWKRLHYLIYCTVLLVILHFIWLVKSDIREPLAYGATATLLLLLRFPFVKSHVFSLSWLQRNKVKNSN
ncbi:MAG: sulfite oxidase heme-binding subunit YedZ [Candidatus Hodarchaeales archaeon]